MILFVSIPYLAPFSTIHKRNAVYHGVVQYRETIIAFVPGGNQLIRKHNPVWRIPLIRCRCNLFTISRFESATMQPEWPVQFGYHLPVVHIKGNLWLTP